MDPNNEGSKDIEKEPSLSEGKKKEIELLKRSRMECYQIVLNEICSLAM